ncbi:hypothetical protein [Ferruginibacter sp.]
MFFKRYSDQIIVILVAIILVLLLILYTDMHIAKIDRQMKETVHQPA